MGIYVNKGTKNFESAGKDGYIEHMNKYDVIQLDIADIRAELGISPQWS
jgi:hypothetical protein